MLLITLLGLAAVQPQTAAMPIDAATIASAIRPRLPQRFSPDVSMVGAAAEGDLLVLSFELPDAALVGATPEMVSARFSAGFCGAPGGRELLDGPMRLRADARSPSGRTVRGMVLEVCPAAPLPRPRD